MALGKRKDEQQEMWVATTSLSFTTSRLVIFTIIVSVPFGLRDTKAVHGSF